MARNASTSHSSKWRQLLKSSRPISWINTAFPFAAGYLANGGVVNGAFWIASLYFLIPYNLLIYVVNDVFDYESDVKNPRKNSIEGGLLPPETHHWMLTVTMLVNLVFLAYLWGQGTVGSNALLTLIAVGAIAYSMPPLRLKERPFLDSLNSSFHFVSPLLFALYVTGWHATYWPYVLSFFLWGCASHAFGAVQDIIADRQANIASIATYLGAQKTVRLSLGLYVAATLMLASTGWPAAVVCLPLLGYSWMVWPYRNLSDAQASKANAGWRHFLILNQGTGFVVTLLLIISKLQ